jgi:hypothetical protein
LLPVNVNDATPPELFSVNVKVGSLLDDKTQVKSAPATTRAAATVSTLVTTVPKVPVLPVMALLASVQLTALISNPAGGVPVTVMTVPMVDTFMDVGAAGVAVLAAVVAMFEGVLVKFVWMKLNADGELAPPCVVTCSLKVGVLLVVIVHVMSFAVAVAAALKAIRPVA